MVFPILSFAFRTLPPLILKVVLVYGLLTLLYRLLPLSLHTSYWQLAVIARLAAVPFLLKLERPLREHKYGRDAAINGAVKVPIIEDMTPWEVVGVLRKSFTESVTPRKWSKS